MKPLLGALAIAIGVYGAIVLLVLVAAPRSDLLEDVVIGQGHNFGSFFMILLVPSAFLSERLFAKRQRK